MNKKETKRRLTKAQTARLIKKGDLKAVLQAIFDPGLIKDDVAGLVDGAREMVDSVREQAAGGEIDQALLDQVAGALEVAVDYVEDMEGEAEAEVPMVEAAADMPVEPVPPELSAGMANGGKVSKTKKVAKAEEGEGTKEEIEKVEGEEDVPAGDESPPMEGGELPTEAEKMKKSGAPVATRPPRPYAYFQTVEDQKRAMVPKFRSALLKGSLREAQGLVGRDQQFFDEMFNYTLRAEMDQMGWSSRNIKKIHYGAASEFDPDRLQKSIDAADIPGVNLLPLARLMLPVYAGLRRRLPQQAPQTGSDQATWRAQLGFGGLSFGALMSVAEAAIGEASAESFLTFNAPYRDTTINDQVTLKSTFASRGYDDPLQVATIYTLSGLLQAEERVLLGQNEAALTAPTTVTGTPVASGGALADDAYTVSVSALTYRGWLIGADGNDGVANSQGETVATDSAAVVVAGGGGAGSIDATWTAMPGAVAYNVYLNDGTAQRYVATVTTTAYTITAYPGAGNVDNTANTTANANGYEGLIQWCEQSTIYGNAIPNKVTPTDLTGAALTTSNSGIVQFDTMLRTLWNNWQICPSLIIGSANAIGEVTNLLMGLNNASLYRIEVSQERGTIAGGAMVTGYVNKYAPYADGSPRYVDTIAHPYLPDGTFLFVTETIPYPMSREARGWCIETLIPYTYFPLAQSTLVYPFAVTLSESLLCFHPAVQTAITGVDVSGS